LVCADAGEATMRYNALFVWLRRDELRRRTPSLAMREAKETASDMVAVLSTYGREAAQGWLVVVLFAYAGRLLRDAEDAEAGRLMLPNLERGINSIECLAVEDTVQSKHRTMTR
jgi:hypothetical protein